MGIFQARIPEWVAYPFSRGSSWPRNQTGVSCTAGFTSWATREAHETYKSWSKRKLLKIHLMSSWNVTGATYQTEGRNMIERLAILCVVCSLYHLSHTGTTPASHLLLISPILPLKKRSITIRSLPVSAAFPPSHYSCWFLPRITLTSLCLYVFCLEPCKFTSSMKTSLTTLA